MPKTIPHTEVVRLHEWAVRGVYSVISAVPAIMGLGGSIGRQPLWFWWPSVLLALLLIVCMVTDHFTRSNSQRAFYVFVCLILYVGVTLPLYELLGHRFTHLDTLDPKTAQPLWAAMASIAGYPMLTFGMRCSRLMVRWAERSRR